MRESGYRALKKRLNAYHRFSFAMPRRGKGFTPQQKSAITRQWRKLEGQIRRVEKGLGSFVKKPKGVNIKPFPQTGKTNKGFFYPRPGARLEIKKVRGRKKAKLVIKYREIVERLFLFPLEILGNMELIQEWVDYLIAKYRPKYVLWAVNDFIGTRAYRPERFFLYAAQLMANAKFKKDFDNARDEDKNFLTGVYLGYER